MTLRSMGGALVGLVILSAACNDQIVKGCFTSANPAAQQADLAIEIGLPRQCHLTIANPGNAVTLIAMLTAAPVEFYNGRVTAHQMFAFHNGVWVEVSSPPFQLQWISAVECGSRACVPVDAQWSAATGTSQNGIYKDRWQATGATTHGDGVVFTDFTGTAGAAAGIGGTAAPVGGDGKQLDNPGYLGGTLTGRHTLVRVSMALGRIAGCNDAHLFSSIQRRVRDTTHLEEYRDLDGWHEGHSFKGCHSCLGSISQRTERIGSRRGRRLAGCYAWSTLPADVV